MCPLIQDIAKKCVESIEQGNEGFLIIATKDFRNLYKSSTIRRYIRMLSREGYIYYIPGSFRHIKELNICTPKLYRVDSHFFDIFLLYEILSVEEPLRMDDTSQPLKASPSVRLINRNSKTPFILLNNKSSKNETSKNRSFWRNIYKDIYSQNSSFEVSKLMIANFGFLNTNYRSLKKEQEKVENRGGDHNNISLVVSFYPDNDWYERTFPSIKSFWVYCTKIGYNKSYKTLHRQIKQGKRDFGNIEITKIENK
jgi:hypothetical protein